MAESFKMTKDGKAGLEEAFEVFPDLPWKKDSSGQAHVFDEKKGEYVPVNKGDFIVHIGERYEVSDKKPANAKKAEPKDEEESDSDEVPGEAKRVEPQPDPEEGEAEVASTPNGAASFE